MQNKDNKQRGYTIIETMIAVSLFLVVISIGMSALLNANLIHQKSRDTRSIMDNLSFIMEDMSRNLRTGSNYRCITGPDDLSDLSTPRSGESCFGIAFTSTAYNTTSTWVYYIDNSGRIWKSTEGPYNNPPVNYIQMTPDEVFISGNVSGTQISGFSVLGAEPPSVPSNNFQQPFVTIRLVGKIIIINKNVETPFSLQTSVSQRLIDI